MFIADSQIHIWRAQSPDRQWNEGGASYAHFDGAPFLAEDVLPQMDRAGVDRALIVSPSWEGYRNDAVLEASTQYPDRFRAMVRFDLREQNDAQVAAWAADPRVAGARVLFALNMESWLRDGIAEWFWAAAERHDLPVMVYAAHQHDGIRRVAEQYPGLRLALCHLNIDVSLRDDQIAPHIDRLIALADLPNVSVKASSLPSYVTDDYPYRSLHGHLERLVCAFGRERVFWGSDLSRLRGSYEELIDLFVKELPFLDDQDRAWIMGKGLMGWVNWQVDPTMV